MRSLEGSHNGCRGARVRVRILQRQRCVRLRAHSGCEHSASRNHPRRRRPRDRAARLLAARCSRARPSTVHSRPFQPTAVHEAGDSGTNIRAKPRGGVREKPPRTMEALRRRLTLQREGSRGTPFMRVVWMQRTPSGVPPREARARGINTVWAGALCVEQLAASQRSASYTASTPRPPRRTPAEQAIPVAANAETAKHPPVPRPPN